MEENHNDFMAFDPVGTTLIGAIIILVIAVVLYLNNRGHILKRKGGTPSKSEKYIENDLTLPITQLNINKRKYPMLGRNVETDLPEKGIAEVTIYYKDDVQGESALQNTDVYKHWSIDPYEALVHQRIYATYLSNVDLTDKDAKIQEKDHALTMRDREIAALYEKLERKHMAQPIQDAYDTAQNAKISSNASPVYPARAKSEDKDKDEKKDEYREEDSESGDEYE